MLSYNIQALKGDNSMIDMAMQNKNDDKKVWWRRPLICDGKLNRETWRLHRNNSIPMLWENYLNARKRRQQHIILSVLIWPIGGAVRLC